VIEHAEAKRRFCELLGGTFLNSKTDPHFQEEVFDKTSGRGVGVSFECAGAPSALKTAVAVTAPSAADLRDGHLSRPICVRLQPTPGRRKTIVMSLAYGNEFPAIIAMLADGRLRADALITNCIPLSAGCEYIRDFETRGAANLKTFLEVDSRA
jgi:(R,R)-butanediol dehydrogenase/meso-butanediol dehydrogenase/diacetyl reductase